MVFRVISGLYVVPKYSRAINEYSFPTVVEVADKIADKYSWNICPTDETGLNIFGLSTQLSNSYVFVTDGAYREYNYRGKTIVFKRSNNRTISEYSRELSIVIQAMKYIGEKNIKEEDIERIGIFCKKYVNEDLMNDTKKLPVWIHNILS